MTLSEMSGMTENCSPTCRGRDREPSLHAGPHRRRGPAGLEGVPGEGRRAAGHGQGDPRGAGAGHRGDGAGRAESRGGRGQLLDESLLEGDDTEGAPPPAAVRRGRSATSIRSPPGEDDARDAGRDPARRPAEDALFERAGVRTASTRDERPDGQGPPRTVRTRGHRTQPSGGGTHRGSEAAEADPTLGRGPDADRRCRRLPTPRDGRRARNERS